MKRWWNSILLLRLDCVLNAWGALRIAGRLTPEHLLRQVFETCGTYDEARQQRRSRGRGCSCSWGCAPGECVVLERDGERARTYREGTAVANDWQEERPGWRPRCCSEGGPVENNRARRAALVAWTGRGGSDTAWVTRPVLNGCTRLSVEMVPASGHLVVAGWEPDGRGSAAPATAVTAFQAFSTAV